MGSLIIAFQAPGRKPVSVAIVDDPELLNMVAQFAIQQAEQRVTAAAKSDPVMARLQAAEVQRLRTALGILVPGITDEQLTSIGVA
jgi:hypothetical protein